MRKLMFGLALVVGAGAFASGAKAEPFPFPPGAFEAGHYQDVEYYGRDWRAREYWRHRRHEEWRRHEAFREHERWEHRRF